MAEKSDVPTNFDGFYALRNVLSNKENNKFKKVKKVTPKILKLEKRNCTSPSKIMFYLPIAQDFPDYSKIIDDNTVRNFSESIGDAKIISKFGTPEEILTVKIPYGYEVIEEYWVHKPFAKVYILYNNVKNEYLYYLVEPLLSKDESIILSELKEIVRTKLLYTNIDNSNKYKLLEDIIRNILEEYGLKFEQTIFAKFYYYIKRDFLGFYKIDGIMKDPYVEDISCDGWNIPIFVYHWNYGNIPTNVKMDRNELDSFVIRLAQRSGKFVSTSNPMVDATLPDGSRIQLTLGSEVTARGSTFTIRKFKEILITPIDLIKWGTFSLDEMAYLWLATENGKSILIVGGTASGKTTTLNAIALFIPLNAKIVTIEDTRELMLIHPNWIPAVTKESFVDGDKGKIDMYDLLKAALRQRPEYIIVGEVRGREAQTLFQAMSTGHTTMSTFHADSVEAAIHRLEYPPLSVPRSMISALDIVCVQSQTFVKGRRVRRNINITEITDIDPITKNLKTMDIYHWEPSTDTHRFLLNDIWSSKVMEDIMKFKAWDEDDLEKEFEKRKLILKRLVKMNITSKEFVNFMKVYQAKPEEVTKKLIGDVL